MVEDTDFLGLRKEGNPTDKFLDDFKETLDKIDRFAVDMK